MLTIRKEQYAVFEKNEVKKFEDPTYLYLNEHDAERCQDLGEPRLRKLIQYGINRAASYSIHLENDVRKYIEVMLLLGPDFDKDPKFPWAPSLLTDKNLSDPKVKASRLHEAALKNVPDQT